LNTGDFISTRQGDDILEAINSDNNEYEKSTKEFRCKTTVDYKNAMVLTEHGLRPITKEEIEALKNH
jgi:hypothetical protein